MKTIWGKVGAIVAAAALVAVLVFSYVSAITNYDFTVFIFAGAADQETNRQLIEEWAAQYAEGHKAEIGKDSINVGISFQSDTTCIFRRCRGKSLPARQTTCFMFRRSMSSPLR